MPAHAAVQHCACVVSSRRTNIALSWQAGCRRGQKSLLRRISPWRQVLARSSGQLGSLQPILTDNLADMRAAGESSLVDDMQVENPFEAGAQPSEDTEPAQSDDSVRCQANMVECTPSTWPCAFQMCIEYIVTLPYTT